MDGAQETSWPKTRPACATQDARKRTGLRKSFIIATYGVHSLALLVQRLLHRRLEEAGIDFSPVRAMQALSTLRVVTLRLDDHPERRGVSGGCPDARRVLKTVGVTELRPPDPPDHEKTVM
jgi:hypothetical protein